MAKARLKVIPLGGLGEIGKNLLLFEYGPDILMVDAGLMFPGEEMQGIDLVIPDISYLLENRERIRGIVITHGHEDHIGALPYILPQLKVPVYMTRLTYGLVRVKLKEAKALAEAELNIVETGQTVNIGKFRVEFYPVCHSIPDAAGLIIHTPIGDVVHSGDFKLDYTPVSGKPTDLSRLSQVGSRGVLLLCSDSTYAERPGYTPSETVVGETLDRIVGQATGRVIVTTFSSLISRVQQVVDAATRHGRRVFFVGRSMTDNTRMAMEMGYLKAEEGVVGRIDEIQKLPPERIVFVTTGSQGEPTSALVRIANRDHRHVHIQPGDTVILSATPIPGNESVVNRTVDMLFKQGALVLYEKSAMVHVHGHASQEELKLILSLVKPKYFLPIHGEYRHLSSHSRLAQTLGMPAANAFVMEDGDVLEITTTAARKYGKVKAGHVYVNGISARDPGGVAYRQRRLQSGDGIVVVIITMSQETGALEGMPDVVTRGFDGNGDIREIVERSRVLVAEALGAQPGHTMDWGFVRIKVRNVLEKYIYERTRRRPVVLPYVIKV